MSDEHETNSHLAYPDGPEMAQMAIRGMMTVGAYGASGLGDSAPAAFAQVLADLLALATHMDLHVNVTCHPNGSHEMSVATAAAVASEQLPDDAGEQLADELARFLGEQQ